MLPALVVYCINSNQPTRAKDKAMVMAMPRTRRRHKTRTVAEIRRTLK